MVTITFGRFLDYYKNAPVIEKPTGRSRETGKMGKDKVSGGRRKHEAEPGFKRLFINLGKADGFYPGEIMQYLNKHIHGRQEVGHIDLLQKFSYIEVPEDDAKKVMKALNGTVYKGREVRCNDAEEAGHGRASRGAGSRSERAPKREKPRREDSSRSRSPRRGAERSKNYGGKQDDWRGLMKEAKDIKLRGSEPDFSEEGWARRYPKKKK
jgi:ATP-dependent RNA helicase DeaD